jgi:hypothetical protein
MFLRSNNRKKDGKDHGYSSIVENHGLASGKTVQRTVVYLGEINDEKQAAWRKTLSVFDEEQQEYSNLSLFPDNREIPADAVDRLQVKLSRLNCGGLGSSGVAGWGASCGGNWGSISSGTLAWRDREKTWLGKKCCNCWW